MKEDLYIYTQDGERQQLDLSTPSGITLKWVSNLFSDISKLTCSYSYTFKLPMTQHNIRTLNIVNDMRAKSAMARVSNKAEFYINGICLCPNANLYLSEVGTDSFSCVMTWRVLKAFETLKSAQTKINELPSVGNFTWKTGDCELIYGYPSNLWKNTDNILYPNYDAGVPYEDGTPPKPVVPIYRIVQMINAHFGVKFKIGREISERMGTLPIDNFNNKNYYGACVYDDFITHGVVPITGLTPFTVNKYTARNVKFVNSNSEYDCYLVIDGSVDQEGTYRKFVNENDDTKFFRENENWNNTDVIDLHYWGGVAVIAEDPASANHSTPIDVKWNEYVETGRFMHSTRETSVQEDNVETLNVWKSWTGSNGRYRGYAVHEAQRTLEHYFKILESNTQAGLRALRCKAECTMRGAATIRVKKSAVTAGRTTAPDYWWIYLIEAKKNDEGEVTLDTYSEQSDDWMGFRSIQKEETDSEYIYYFDFGINYEVRQIKIDPIEDDNTIGVLFWSGYEYTPTNNIDTFQYDDVLFDEIVIDSITPTIEEVSTLPVEMDIIGNLPDISCFDFMKDLFYLNGALPKIERDGETISAMFYNQLRDRTFAGEGLDWSKKLIGAHTDKPSSVKYENSNFGQKNYFEMAYSKRGKSNEELANELDLYDDGYGTIGINDKILDEEKSLYTAKFYPGLRRDIRYPNMIVGKTTKVWDGEKQLNTSANPVYGYLNFRKLNPLYEDVTDIDKRPMIKDNGGDFEHIRMDVFEPFQEISETFGYLQAILENYTCVKEKLRLTEFDLQNFDESVPVYLDKYNTFFAVSSIQRDKNGISTVELIKLPYVEPVYKPVRGNGLEEETYSYTYSSLISFTLNMVRTYTNNRHPICYDYYVNGRHETWRTTYNTLSVPVSNYVPRFVFPYNDNWNREPYSLNIYIPENVAYTLTKKKGFDTIYTKKMTVALRVYFDDVKLDAGAHTLTFTDAEDGQYHIFKFIFDIFNKEGELIEQFRKKMYYFVYSKDESVMTDDFGDVHESEDNFETETKIKKESYNWEILMDLQSNGEPCKIMVGNASSYSITSETKDGKSYASFNSQMREIIAPFVQSIDNWDSETYNLYLLKPTAEAIIEEHTAPVIYDTYSQTQEVKIYWDDKELTETEMAGTTPIATFSKNNYNDTHTIKIEFDIKDKEGNILAHRLYTTEYHVLGFATEKVDTYTTELLFAFASDAKNANGELLPTYYIKNQYGTISSQYNEVIESGMKLKIEEGVHRVASNFDQQNGVQSYRIFSIDNSGQGKFIARSRYIKKTGDTVTLNQTVDKECKVYWDGTLITNLNHVLKMTLEHSGGQWWGYDEEIHELKIEYDNINSDGTFTTKTLTVKVYSQNGNSFIYNY